MVEMVAHALFQQFCTMVSDVPLPAKKVFQTVPSVKNGRAVLQRQIVQLSFLNLFLVACFGVLLRGFPFLQSFPLAYKNLLHGHSHFAFGGWVMPVLLALVLRYFPELESKVAYKHWRNIAVLLFASAYGMLASFPVQGYGVVSIIFSTISVAAGYYMAVVLWKAIAAAKKATSHLFLKAGLVYLAISAIGPFATGPLIAMGYHGTPLYYNAVYFYLHFQYNGWFTFAVLALLYKMLEDKKEVKGGKTVFTLLALSCTPAYFLSVLWNQPSLVFHIIGGAAALAQVIACIFLIKDTRCFEWKQNWIGTLFRLSVAAFVLKNVLQLTSAFPAIAVLGYQYRNFVIAYLHLVLLGFISLFAVAAVFKSYSFTGNNNIRSGTGFFLFSFITTELLLVLSAAGTVFNFGIPFYIQLLLLFSLFFPVGLFIIWKDVRSRLKTAFQ